MLTSYLAAVGVLAPGARLTNTALGLDTNSLPSQHSTDMANKETILTVGGRPYLTDSAEY